MKKLILGLLAAFLSTTLFCAPAQKGKTVEKFVGAYQMAPQQQKYQKSCAKRHNGFWYITNVGTTARPLLKGFCRIVKPVSPFGEMG